MTVAVGVAVPPAVAIALAVDLVMDLVMGPVVAPVVAVNCSEVSDFAQTGGVEETTTRLDSSSSSLSST